MRRNVTLNSWRDMVKLEEYDAMQDCVATWASCAIGEAHEAYPDVVEIQTGDGRPTDDKLLRLGLGLMDIVEYARGAGEPWHIRAALDDIEERVWELMNEKYPEAPDDHHFDIGGEG